MNCRQVSFGSFHFSFFGFGAIFHFVSGASRGSGSIQGPQKINLEAAGVYKRHVVLKSLLKKPKKSAKLAFDCFPSWFSTEIFGIVQI